LRTSSLDSNLYFVQTLTTRPSYHSVLMACWPMKGQ